MSNHMEYPALFEPAPEGGFIVTIPDFGWGVSQGDTEDEALQMAIALLQTPSRWRTPAPTRSCG
jgi:predicted RNase H-like HicB family nuclease